MKVYLQVHTPTVFKGKAGMEFIKENLTKPVRYQRKTGNIVDSIKDKFNIKSNGANDILEALVDEIKSLRIYCEKSERLLKKFKDENQRLEWQSLINSAELEEKENKIRSLRQNNFLLTK